MGAVAAVTSIIATAASTGVAIHNADVQAENADIISRRQAQAQQDEVDQLQKSQKDAQKEANKQTLLTQNQEAQQQQLESDKAKRLARQSTGGRDSTILTGPRGLNYESTQKTLIGE